MIPSAFVKTNFGKLILRNIVQLDFRIEGTFLVYFSYLNKNYKQHFIKDNEVNKKYENGGKPPKLFVPSEGFDQNLITNFK